MAYGNSFQRTTPIVLNLIIINVIIYFAQSVFGGVTTLVAGTEESNRVYDLFALHYYKSTFFRPYQVVTHMFMHGSFFHLLFNMLGLWMFGTIIERVWGPKRFLIFYLICGLAAAATQMASYAYDFASVDMSNTNTLQYAMSQYSATVGASGAIMGVLAAYGYLFPNTELFIMPIPFPIKAKWAILGIIAMDVFGGVSKTPNDNVAHFAHVGGALVGFILVLYWNKTNKQTFY
jgi:membrane associated rhomboid family serine protease